MKDTMKLRWLLAALLLTASMPLLAQPKIEHTAPSCLRSGRVYVFNVVTPSEGELRLFYRRTNSTWCSVVGSNHRANSYVAAPRLNDGDELEYFFVLLNKSQVIARSPEIYHVKVNERCETTPLRVLETPPLDCSEQANLFGAANSAAYALIPAGTPEPASHDTPDR
jgi:hypothetical protein